MEQQQQQQQQQHASTFHPHHDNVSGSSLMLSKSYIHDFGGGIGWW